MYVCYKMVLKVEPEFKIRLTRGYNLNADSNNGLLGSTSPPDEIRYTSASGWAPSQFRPLDGLPVFKNLERPLRPLNPNLKRTKKLAVKPLPLSNFSIFFFFVAPSD